MNRLGGESQFEIQIDPKLPVHTGVWGNCMSWLHMAVAKSTDQYRPLLIPNGPQAFVASFGPAPCVGLKQ